MGARKEATYFLVAKALRLRIDQLNVIDGSLRTLVFGIFTGKRNRLADYIDTLMAMLEDSYIPDTDKLEVIKLLENARDACSRFNISDDIHLLIGDIRRSIT